MELCFIHQHHQFRWEEIIGHYRACSLETKPVSPDRLPLRLPQSESVNVNFFIEDVGNLNEKAKKEKNWGGRDPNSLSLI